MTLEEALEENRVLRELNGGPLLWTLRTGRGDANLESSS